MQTGSTAIFMVNHNGSGSGNGSGSDNDSGSGSDHVCGNGRGVVVGAFCVFLKLVKDAGSKDVAVVKVADGKPTEVTPPKKDVQKTSMVVTAAAGNDEVEEYKAKLAEKRRLAREKAELEAAQQEEIRRQQQSVAISVLLTLSVHVLL